MRGPMHTSVNEEIECPGCGKTLPKAECHEDGAICLGCGRTQDWPILRVEREDRPSGPAYLVWRGSEPIARFSRAESGGHADVESEGGGVFFYRLCSVRFMRMVLAMDEFYLGRDKEGAHAVGGRLSAT